MSRSAFAVDPLGGGLGGCSAGVTPPDSEDYLRTTWDNWGISEEPDSRSRGGGGVASALRVRAVEFGFFARAAQERPLARPGARAARSGAEAL